MTLLNRFVLVGLLSEIRVDLYSSHVKIKMSVDVNSTTLTLYSAISRRFNQDKYESIMQLLPLLNPKSDGWTYVNGRDKYYHFIQSSDKDDRTLLFVTGNIMPLNNILFFNMEYAKMANKNATQGIRIEIEGQFIDDNNFINIVYDSPRIFHLPQNNRIALNQPYRIELKYLSEYSIKNDTVMLNLNNNDFEYVSIKKSNNKTIQKNDINEYLIEWEIMNEG